MNSFLIWLIPHSCHYIFSFVQSFSYASMIFMHLLVRKFYPLVLYRIVQRYQGKGIVLKNHAAGQKRGAFIVFKALVC